MVGAGVMAVTAILPLAAAATAEASTGTSAHATSEDAAAAAGWHRRGPFSTYAACDQVRSHWVSLGYATQPCYYLKCDSGCTTPGVRTGWYYLIWQ